MAMNPTTKYTHTPTILCIYRIRNFQGIIDILITTTYTTYIFANLYHCPLLRNFFLVLVSRKLHACNGINNPLLSTSYLSQAHGNNHSQPTSCCQWLNVIKILVTIHSTHLRLNGICAKSFCLQQMNNRRPFLVGWFNGNVAVSTVYKWRHSDVIVINL